MGFPKCDGCCTVTAAELNYMYDPHDIKSSMLENAINTTKLQYCYAVQDISHDYMVVDAFTKPEGYNETIMCANIGDCCTNPGFSQCVFCCEITGCSVPDFLCVTPNCISASSHFKKCCGGTLEAAYCLYNAFDISNYDYFCFLIKHHRNQVVTCCKTTLYTCYYTKFSNTVIDCKCNAYVFWNASCNWNEVFCYVIEGKRNCNKWFIYNNSILSEIYCCNIFPKIIQCFYSYGSVLNDTLQPCISDYSMVCVGCFLFCKTSCPTSTYKQTELIGNYSNYICCINTPKMCVINEGGNWDYFCDFCASFYNPIRVGYNRDLQMCVKCYYTPFECAIEFGFKVCFKETQSYYCDPPCFCMTYCFGEDSSVCCACGTFNGNFVCCYKYVKINNNCWSFYCNNVCKCNIVLNSFPNFCGRLWYKGDYQNGCGCLLWYDSYVVLFTGDGFFCTNNICYSSPVRTSYLSLDKEGEGSVVYNVINPTNNCCIACNLVPNCLYSLNCCIQCHAYEIIQLADGISCIKSYAIVTGTM